MPRKPVCRTKGGGDRREPWGAKAREEEKNESKAQGEDYPIRRAIIRSVLNPMEERRKRGRKVIDGELTEYKWTQKGLQGGGMGAKNAPQQPKPRHRDRTSTVRREHNVALAATSKEACRPKATSVAFKRPTPDEKKVN